MTSTRTPTYIIVGGGTSGLVLANRLSSDPSAQILILEAGEDLSSDPRVTTPALFATLSGNPDTDWCYATVPQPGLNGRSVRVPQGKCLGGLSAINCQAFIAPARADYDGWAKIVGDAGWAWDGLKGYLGKTYTLSLPEDKETRRHLGIDEWVDEAAHGTDGPLKVYFPGVKENPVGKAWVDALRGLGKTTSADPFSGKSIGGYSSMVTVDPVTKTRSYAVTAYGYPALERPNVQLVTGARVHKILFEKTSAGSVRATGVQASINGAPVETFTTTKEVILSAGVFNTPKLLELSGIGSKDLLAKHDIPVVVHLPGVGENLQDHLMTGISYEVADGIATGDPLLRGEPEALALAQKLYAEHRAGPLVFGGVQSHAYMPTPGPAAEVAAALDAQPPSGPRDADRAAILRSVVEDPGEASAAWFIFLAQVNLHASGKSFVGSELQPGNFASLGVSQSHPFSRGSSHISSSDVGAPPAIDHQYLSHPADLEIMARHVQALDRLRHAPALSALFKPGGRRNHADAFAAGQGLEGAKRYVLDTATSTEHSCGTAAMGPRREGGVVDGRLRVHGVENLRVVDASVFPLIPRGNIQSSVYAVAEKAADLIREG